MRIYNPPFRSLSCLIILIFSAAGAVAFDRSGAKQSVQALQGLDDAKIVLVLPFSHRRVRVDFENASAIQRLGSMIQAELKINDPKREDKKLVRALEYFGKICKTDLVGCNSVEKVRGCHELAELAMVVNNASRRPIPAHIDAFQSGAVFFRKIYSPVGRGRSEAGNLMACLEKDSSKCDPAPGTFWTKPPNISAQDLAAGFGRERTPDFSQKIFEYSGPKESYGRNPGVEVRTGKKVFKLKFAEVSCEPFATRIFACLGYHVDITDYLRAPRVRYNRRLFLEFNSRKSLGTRFTIFGLIPVYHLELQNHYDPFDFVARAVFRDGSECDGMELRKKLLKASGTKILTDDSFRGKVEGAIDYLVFANANLQGKDKSIKSLGAWDFNQLDHPDLRELRGAGVLAAWLGWFDTRFDNTRLKVVRENGEEKLEHVFSDLGGVLGETAGFLYARGEMSAAFPWSFTDQRGTGGRFRIVGYKPVERVAPFARMTINDARWMGRMMGQITREQIHNALEASGYGTEEVAIYTSKLIHRRDKMMTDLALRDGTQAVRLSTGEKKGREKAGQSNQSRGSNL
jgi:hypothetical protein